MTRANPKKSVGLSTIPKKKSLHQKLTPKKSHAEFPSTNFQILNVMRNIETAKTELKLKRPLQTWTDPTT